MNVKNLAKELDLKQITEAAADTDITGVCIGDLLSIIMTKCAAGDVWITMQTHPNILSVADLNDAAGIIVAGGMQLEQSLIDKAQEAGVALFTTDMEEYELAWKIHEVL